MTDCLEQVRNDIKATNEKLSALNTNSKSTRPKTKENETVKHDNAEKSKKRKEKRVSNRTWDIAVMVMNEKAGLDLAARYLQKCKWVFQILPFLQVIKSITCKFLRVDLILKTCSLFCHFIFLLVAFSILLVKIYATSKKLLVARKL